MKFSLQFFGANVYSEKSSFFEGNFNEKFNSYTALTTIDIGYYLTVLYSLYILFSIFFGFDVKQCFIKFYPAKSS